MKLYTRIIIFLFVVVLIFVAWFFADCYFNPIIKSKDFYYIVKPGVHAKSVALDLSQQASLRHPLFFRLMVRLSGDGHKLQSGEYFFRKGSSINDIVKQIANGEIYYHTFMIIEGWNFYQVMDELNNSKLIKHTLNNLSNEEIAKKLGIERKTPEGLLFPDTYYFALGDSDLAILQHAYQEMQDYLQKAWPKRAKDLPCKNSYQALVVASMVEKETAVASEKPLVAAIILRRFKGWIHLQIDATVIYGLEPDFTGNLTKEDLTKKTPYNTYTNYGLPPTPIAMPGAVSIQAALHPATTNMLYFVAKGDGTHAFSATLDQHNTKVAKYRKQGSKEEDKAAKESEVANKNRIEHG
jgi:UPF0755 protein